MNIAGLLFLLVVQFVCGRGVLYLFKIQQPPMVTGALSMILGIGVVSLLPFILELAHIPISFTSVLLIICIATALLSIPLVKAFRAKQFVMPKFSIQLYEAPFFLIYLLIIAVSTWLCFYYPPTPRDMLAGPELVAAYTVRDHTMINSVFMLDLSTTNNHLKPPFITCLQVVYKLFVSPFGQTWLTMLFISLIIWLYSLLKETLHPIVACFLLLFFITQPEVFAYTILMLFDYANMIFFFAGFYFLVRYVTFQQKNELYFSALLFGLATYIRSETLFLVVLLLPVLVYSLYKSKANVRTFLFRAGIFVALPAFFYFIWINIFVKYYMPVTFDVGGEVNKHLSDISILFTRIADNARQLIFSSNGTVLWGYFVFFFLSILLTDLLFFRKFSKEALLCLYGIAVVFFGLSILGYIFPLVDVLNTTKRGLLKFLPLMLLYLRSSGVVMQVSEKIRTWEVGKEPTAIS